MKPTEEEIIEYIELCEWIENQPKKCAYTSKIPKEYAHLINATKRYVEVRNWMYKNDCSCLFYSSGWGWRLRKNWRDRLDSIKEK